MSIENALTTAWMFGSSGTRTDSLGGEKSGMREGREEKGKEIETGESRHIHIHTRTQNKV